MATEAETLTSHSDHHAILRCRACKATGRRCFTLVYVTRAYAGRPVTDQSVEINGRVSRIRDRFDLKRRLHMPCPSCGSSEVRVQIVKGVYVADKDCNAKCMGATGPSCECSCAGENHGGRHGTWT